VMTAWKTERDAILNMINQFGDGTFSTVVDSYDFEKTMEKVVPSVAPEMKKKKGTWIFRPDSGDPAESVILALRTAEKNFGATVNKKGFKVLNKTAVIQGDGISGKAAIRKILDAVLKEGFAAQNVAFGMGGALLQRVHRDNMSFATKLSFIEYTDGTKRDVMKTPKGDTGKISLPGILRVKRHQNGLEYVYPRSDTDDSYDSDDILRVVYDCKPIANVWDDFDTIKRRVETQWHSSPKQHDPISEPLKQKIKRWVEHQKQVLEQMYKL